MRVLICITSLALILAGGGGWIYGSASIEGLHEEPKQEPKNAMEQVPTCGTAAAEGEQKEGRNNDGEPFRKRDTGVVERTTAGEEAHSQIQTSVGSGEDGMSDITIRAGRATEDRKRTTERASNSEVSKPHDLDDSRSYGYLGVFSITAYTAGYESTQKKKGEKGYGITAAGTYVKEGRTIAADWGVLPPGSVVQIEGLEGTYVVEDKGGGVNGNHIDLYIASLDAAKKWGRQKRSVWVVEWGLPR